MAEPDFFIHQPLRLKLMAALYANADGEALDFPRLKALTEATDGNLGSHLTALDQSGYVAIEKDNSGARARSLVTLTAQGRKAFRRHVAYLREIVDSVTD
ncbi:transcriptional regulator [Roseateles cellulosilyticus]|uniref:Transcriptional regulator n=1 Tax=Pelomonas cellulosilytica TaxID=2906762 RepID=A0ABS8XR39_9BURK|nr:transcriptional regulator [Pelomonas sp. P8]MCE4555206.1 transcriptional regulator [Pelomonas sp. P8]